MAMSLVTKVQCIPKWAFDLSEDLLTAEEWAALRNAGQKDAA